MGKRITDNIITGNDTRLGFCLYYSPYFGKNIWRRSSSLTGKRTKKDPAFGGFRKSSNRLKEASPIAASLYKELPKPVKQYPLYRTLTGEAIQMLKEGMDAARIKEALQKNYIDPLLAAPKKKTRMVDNVGKKEPVKGMSSFIALPQLPIRTNQITRTRRSHILQKIIEGQPASDYYSTSGSVHQTYSKIQSASNTAELPKRRRKSTDGLIYLGRLPECKKLKIWLRPMDSSV